MFKKAKNSSESQFESPETFDRLQSSGLDVKEAVETRIADIKRELANPLNPTHPWAADDRTQLVLGWSSLAYAADRIAEIVGQETEKDNTDGHHVMPCVDNSFATAMTEKSFELNKYAQNLQIEKGLEAIIDNETQTDLTLVNHLPTLPEYPANTETYEDPQDRHKDAGVADEAFVGALLTAVDELQAYAYTLASELHDSSQTPGEIPELYASLQSVIQGEYLDHAQQQIDYAKGCLFNTAGAVPDHLVAEAYEATYYAMQLTAQAFTALHCPATFGPDWVLERQ